MSDEPFGQCPKCGGDLIVVDVPRGGIAVVCSWCERTYYNPKHGKCDVDVARNEFMSLFGNDEVV